MNELPELQKWLSDNMPEIEEFITYSKSCISASRDELDETGAKINMMASKSGYHLADVELYLETEKARIANSVPEEMGPTERKAYVEGKTAQLRHLRNRLRVLVRSLKNLSISVCSVRKSLREV